MKSILFVCLGNICRSPTAKAVFDWKLKQAELEVETDSAGTSDYHAGSSPDPRAQQIAERWGLDISSDRARVVRPADFRRFDAIFVMDRSNLADLHAMKPEGAMSRLELVMSLAPEYGVEEVPDPYYGGEDGFRRVLDMLEAAADRLVQDLRPERR